MKQLILINELSYKDGKDRGYAKHMSQPILDFATIANVTGNITVTVDE